MRKRILYILMVLAGVMLFFASCQQDECFTYRDESVPEGYVALHFGVNMPPMPVVQTRGVDPDGGGVQNMTLFCFDSYGLFITTTKAEIVSTGALSGTFNAEVPMNTKRIHFLANQIMTSFKESDFRNKSESEVMSVLEGSAGMMIYWGRFACPDMTQPIEGQLPQEITLYRNQAKVNIDNWETPYLTVTGFAVCNTNAFGTVAPFNPDETGNERWDWPGKSPYVTLPVDKSKLSDIVDVQISKDQYVFECENGVDDPVSVIIRGRVSGETTDKYYRVMLVDDKGEQVLIRRNFHYRLFIAGPLSYGQPTFEDALTAAATNNVWVSISDEVNSVEDKDFILEVEKTNVVLPAPTVEDSRIVSLYYSLTAKGVNSIDEVADKPAVTWLDGNTVAANTFENQFAVNGKTGEGTLTLSLFSLGPDEQKREGTLLVKKGHLQRKIKVITIKEQRFVPAWAAAQVNGAMTGTGSNIKGANATLMFTVPESCPEELFPMRVLITVNDLDVRHESGMDLPVVFRGEEGYGKDLGDKDCGYKYVYTAEKAGVQRVYFENILDKQEGAEVPVVIEADFFETLDRTFVFASHNKQITVSGLQEYRAASGDDFAADEKIYYRLVPQKINAPVKFEMVMKDGEVPMNVGKDDEFLLYAQNLTYYKDGDVWDGVSEFDCEFFDGEYADEIAGDIMVFRPKRDRLNPAQTGEYTVYMKTVKAESAEVVRIASIQEGMYSPWTRWQYTGAAYRSITFELANYNPFRFHATVGGVGKDDFIPYNAAGYSSADVEKVTALKWDYEPGKEVDIAFDVTSFRGTDNNSADPFGTEFEIYIDAPMLEIDEARLGDLQGKLVADPNVEGRFIYTVDADRVAERRYGKEVAYKEDATGVNQEGERKVLPFKKKAIVSAGNIVLSSDKSKVVFFDKVFKVTNTPIRGTIHYTDMQPDDVGYPGILNPIGRGKFVTFELVATGSRIGSMTITTDGSYELRLRKEYKFAWGNGAVELQYTHDDGKVYHRTVESLAILKDNSDLVLVPAVE